LGHALEPLGPVEPFRDVVIEHLDTDFDAKQSGLPLTCRGKSQEHSSDMHRLYDPSAHCQLNHVTDRQADNTRPFGWVVDGRGLGINVTGENHMAEIIVACRIGCEASDVLPLRSAETRLLF
jgi:hypothetical protein